MTCRWSKNANTTIKSGISNNFVSITKIPCEKYCRQHESAADRLSSYFELFILNFDISGYIILFDLTDDQELRVNKHPLKKF